MKPEFDYENANKGAIIITKKERHIKFFKYWQNSDYSKCVILIDFKNEDGEKVKLWKEFYAVENKACLIACIEAIIKFWPRYDVQKHDMVTSSGHFHSIHKVKKKKRKGKK